MPFDYNADFPERRLIETLTVLLLATHLLAMNVASAGPLIAVWLARRGGASDAVAVRRRVVARRLLRRSLAAFALGALGGGVLLLMPSPGMYAALARFPASAYWYAAAELLFTAACIGGVMWRLREDKPAGWPEIALALIGALNLLYHFPPLMAVLGELAADRRWTDVDVIHRRDLLALWVRPPILALWAHFTVASFAVAPLAAIWPDGQAKSSAEPGGGETPDPCVAPLGRLALAATTLQLPVGVWLVAASDTTSRDAILGQSAAASLAFGSALLTVVWLLHALAELAWGDASRVRRAAWLIIFVTLLMTATLRWSRTVKAPHRPRTAAAALAR